MNDCSLPMSDFNKITEAKVAALSVLNSTVNVSDPANRGTVLEKVEELSEPTFNNKESMLLIKDILDQVLGTDASTSSSVLTKEESSSVSKAISNMITSSSEQTCG